MGRGDSRRSRKMIRRKSQASFKLRMKRKVAAVKKARSKKK